MHNFCFSPITACYNKVSNRCARWILFESSFQSLIFQQSDILLDETKFILRNPQNSKATNFQPFFLFQSFKAIETNQSNRDVHLKTVSKKKKKKKTRKGRREKTLGSIQFFISSTIPDDRSSQVVRNGSTFLIISSSRRQVSSRGALHFCGKRCWAEGQKAGQEIARLLLANLIVGGCHRCRQGSTDVPLIYNLLTSILTICCRFTAATLFWNAVYNRI